MRVGDSKRFYWYWRNWQDGFNLTRSGITWVWRDKFYVFFFKDYTRRKQ